MLSHIHIRNFVIVQQLELEFTTGMTTLTGETGAGKSILVDALSLVLGDRADSKVIYQDAKRAEITASFHLKSVPEANDWLVAHDLDEDNECQLRRTIPREGRSRAFINGRPVTLQQLRELGELFVNIHGQHEHQALLQRHTQRQILDDFAGLGKTLGKLSKIYHQWREKQDQQDQLQRKSHEREDHIQLLRFQTRELEELGLGEDELDSIDQEHSRLANSDRLLDSCEQSLQTLYDAEDQTIHTRLGNINRDISELTAIDPRLSEANELLSQGMIQIEEAISSLRHYRDQLDTDPKRLQWLEQRLADIHQIARKHQRMPEQLHQHWHELQQELEQLQGSSQQQDNLQQAIDSLYEEYQLLADKIHQQRSKAAKKLGKKIIAELQQLGMPNACFEIEVKAGQALSAQGQDQINFLVNMNPGQSPMPLNKVASGGELSRISLAIQVIAAHSKLVPTLIYDEVDSGIGGGIAEVVGKQLRQLGETRQVLCITHLPQVASQAHQHLQVHKQAHKKHTEVNIQTLLKDERIEELARMLGGIKITASTRKHASEMLSQGQVK
ncbi:MAG: DNA repair protein RecN [Gammaproteobacteria bacterium]|nr:DNA repair protein RecN [Gammaproteobacteria bacterium]